MKIVLDTNVFISGVFFSGPPYQILKAWRDGKLQLIVSPEILEEYERVSDLLANQFPGVNLNPILELLTIKTELFSPAPLTKAVCDDPDDDKFIACALAGKANLIVSGDKHLLKVRNYRGIEIVRPRIFVDQYFTSVVSG